MSRILITSALPYINGIKHLGNLAGSMLPADVYARFMRAQVLPDGKKRHEVLYICATDEHGTPAELAAAKAGQDVRTYCDEQHDIQKRAGEAFGLSYDWFGRSSSAQNRELTQAFCDALDRNGLIEERTDKMVFSIDDGRFLPDRYVEGTCPHCNYPKARGDQCDNCGRLLDPTDLINPYSAVSGSTNLEVRDTKHLYLLQTRVEDKLRAWIGAHTDWPPLALSIANKHLDEGLIDRGITRDLSWGVPVTRNGKPRPGFENKVFYVWFDAPVEYIASTREMFDAKGDPDGWKRWWRLDAGADDVRYVEFMGKDNVAFHTVSFPATIIGSGEPWKMVDTLKAFNWLNWYGGKFSTSMNRGVFMDQALELLPADYWRWYLIANSPESSDSSFTWEQFQATVNKDLADVLGNFVNRIVKFTEKNFDAQVPAGGEAGPLEEKLYSGLSELLAEAADAFEDMEMRKAAQAVRRIWVLGNEYLQEAAPWTAFKTDVARAAVIVRHGLNLVRLYAALAQPLIPATAEKIAACVGAALPLGWPSDDARAELNRLVPGTRVAAGEVLFRKIEDAQIGEWSERFGGAEA
jgi:methionyl-tRNA synthetase